jgi:transcriptional regulator with XRE-family HTH domain
MALTIAGSATNASGGSCGPVRVRQRLRQEDLAAAAGLSQSVVSRIERGQLESVPVGSLRAAFEALGGAPHTDADLARRIARSTRRRATRCALRHRAPTGLGRRLGGRTGVTFSHFGERGSVDLLGGHHQTRTVRTFSALRFPDRGWPVRRWLRTPTGPLGSVGSVQQSPGGYNADFSPRTASQADEGELATGQERVKSGLGGSGGAVTVSVSRAW